MVLEVLKGKRVIPANSFSSGMMCTLCLYVKIKVCVNTIHEYARNVRVHVMPRTVA